MKKIYVADDEVNIRHLINSFLSSEGFLVEEFPDGEALLARFWEQEPDLVILDVMMPGIDGLNVCAAIRQKSQVPILIVSAKDSPLDRVNGITLGSDDYLVKPFLPLELVARVKALFRRCEMNEQTRASGGRKLIFYDISLDRNSHSVSVHDAGLSVTPTEYAFFEYMMERGGMAVAKKELLTKVWNLPEYDQNSRLTDDMLKRLRKKLKESGSSVTVETVWGFGYRLSIPVGEVEE